MNTTQETIRAMMDAHLRASIAQAIVAYESRGVPLRAPRPLDPARDRMGQLIEQVFVQSMYRFIGR